MKTKTAFFSGYLLPIFTLLALAGCSIAPTPPKDSGADQSISPSPQAELQEAISAQDLEKLSALLPSLPASPNGNPEMQLLSLPALPPPPPIPGLPTVAYVHDLNRMLSQLPVPPGVPETKPDSLIASTDPNEEASQVSDNFINSQSEEGLPAGPPPLPDAPAQE